MKDINHMFKFFKDEDEYFEDAQPSDNPHDYYFDVRTDSEFARQKGELVVIITIADHFDKENCCSDRHIGWEHLDLDQVCTGTYVVLDLNLTKDDVENMFLTHGFRKNQVLTMFLNNF